MIYDHPRPAPPSCCHLPLLLHRCCHTALATWARLGCLYADDATLLLPCHCYHTATLILSRRCHTAAAATLPPRPHCCCHTAAAPPHPARRCHSRRCRPVEDTPTAATTPAASIPAAATSAATRYPDHHRHAGTGQPHPRHSATATGPLVTPYLPQPRPPPRPLPLTVHPSPEAAGKWPEDTSNPYVHGQHTGTLGMVHPQLCSVAQHQPN